MAQRLAKPAWILLLALAFAACGRPDGFGSAADVEREIEAAKAATPLPPGATFSPIRLNSGADYQRGSGTSMIQFQAVCAWFDYWAKAIVGNDDRAEARASAIADEIRTWPSYLGSDVSLRSAWDSIIDQARLGDPSGLVQMVELNCT